MKPRILHLLLILAAAQLPAATTPAPAAAPGDAMRIVFLGSSTTDGGTDIVLIRQALAAANRPVPVCINAGVGGDTVADMRARFDRDVRPFKPDLVVLQSGSNDASRGVAPEKVETTLDAIAAAVAAEKAGLIILTPNIRGPAKLADETLLDQYEAAMHRVAAARGAKVAEGYARMKAARAQGQTLIETDQIHPNYEGHRILCRALLDALGHPDVPVPAEMQVEPLPGLVRSWQIKALATATPLDAAAVAALKPDATWTALELPLRTPQKHWWQEQIRQQGYAFALDKLAGPAKRYVGTATYACPEAGRRWLYVGGGLQAVWLNGVRVYTAPPSFRGYHAGRETIPVDMAQGPNPLVIEAGSEFFLSVNDGEF